MILTATVPPRINISPGEARLDHDLMVTMNDKTPGGKTGGCAIGDFAV